MHHVFIIYECDVMWFEFQTSLQSLVVLFILGYFAISMMELCLMPRNLSGRAIDYTTQIGMRLKE